MSEYQERDLSRWGAAVAKTAMHQQWRACAKDSGDVVADTGNWRDDRWDAVDDLYTLKDAEPGYDEMWLETRWHTHAERIDAPDLAKELLDTVTENAPSIRRALNEAMKEDG